MGTVRLYLRSYNTDAALPLRVAQTLHPSSSLIEGGETGTEVGRITTVCGRIREKTLAVRRVTQCFLLFSPSCTAEVQRLYNHSGSYFQNKEKLIIVRWQTYQQASQPDDLKSP